MTNAAHHDRVAELLPAHALDALDPQERREVETHVRECGACRELLAAWRSTAAALAESPPPVQPSPSVRAHLLGLTERSSRSSRSPRRPGRSLGVAASVLFALAAGLLAGILGTRFWVDRELEQRQAAIDRMEERLAASRRDVSAVRRELADLAELAEILATAPPERAVLLAGLDPGSRSRGRLYLDPAEGRGVLLAGDLRPLPEDRVYQLWTIRDGVPRSAGTFRPETSGPAVHLLSELPAEAPDAWAVTIEPTGGVPQPTGEMVLRG